MKIPDREIHLVQGLEPTTKLQVDMKASKVKI